MRDAGRRDQRAGRPVGRLRDTAMGVLVPPDDAEALAAALLEVLAAPERFRSPRQSITQGFSPAQVVERWERALTGQARRQDDADVPYRDPTPLSGCDSARLEPWLAGELDIAYRRRATRLLGYLELSSSTRILDCGCGPGLHLRAIRDLSTARVIGTDGDESTLRQARRSGQTRRSSARISRRCPSPRPASTPCSSPKCSSTSMTRGRCSGDSGRCSGPAASWRSRCLTRAIPGRGIRSTAHGRPWADARSGAGPWWASGRITRGCTPPGSSCGA